MLYTFFFEFFFNFFLKFFPGLQIMALLPKLPHQPQLLQTGILYTTLIIVFPYFLPSPEPP